LGGELKTIIFILILTCLIGLAGPITLSAQETETGENESTAADKVDETTLTIPEETEDNPIQNREGLTTFTLWDFVRMVLILGGVIILIYGIFFMLKRFSGQRLQNNELFTLMSSQSIGNNKALHLVEVGKQIFLIGSADNTVSLISEIQDKESIDEIRFKLADNGGAIQQRNFKDVLSRLFGGGANGSERKDMDQSIEFIQKQRERLKKL
jgi:flagellar protein FliO/FliZ